MLYTGEFGNIDIDAVADGGGVVSYYSFGVQLDGKDKLKSSTDTGHMHNRIPAESPCCGRRRRTTLALPSGAPPGFIVQ